MMHFIIGGARSGKSRYAQQLSTFAASKHQCGVHYVATATALDAEMQKRITRHQLDRPEHWQTVEAPLALTQAITSLPENDVVLIDCLTLWLNNHLFESPEQDFPGLFAQLANVLSARKGDTFVVANEVGLGVIPMGEVSRQFVDLAGWLNQAMAGVADHVSFVAAGLPVPLKGGSIA